MAKQTLTNKEFLKVLKEACKGGKVDDDYLNNYLSYYFPYNLVFKRRE